MGLWRWEKYCNPKLLLDIWGYQSHVWIIMLNYMPSIRAVQDIIEKGIKSVIPSTSPPPLSVIPSTSPPPLSQSVIPSTSPLLYHKVSSPAPPLSSITKCHPLSEHLPSSSIWAKYSTCSVMWDTIKLWHGTHSNYGVGHIQTPMLSFFWTELSQRVRSHSQASL